MIGRLAYVVGDGEQSVQALIEQTNASREKPLASNVLGERAPLPVLVGSEAADWLGKQQGPFASPETDAAFVGVSGA